jgi:excinuclease ABC subunit A
MDEPTTGLHPQEVEQVLLLLRNLVEKGHTVIAIEHNLDCIASCDHMIDLGPGAGDAGGKVIFEGTPKEASKSKSSLTGKFLTSSYS